MLWGDGMAQASHIVRQVDFSGGELREDLKHRDDVQQVQCGARQMANWRIMSSGGLTDRPGRMALFKQEGRTETIVLPGDLRFRLSFGAGTIVVRDTAGAVVASDAGYPWTEETAASACEMAPASPGVWVATPPATSQSSP